MSRVDELLEYLGRKGCAMSRSRILEDLRWPGPELDNAISVLLRERKVRCPRPGEYEVVPEPLNQVVAAAPAPLASRAMETIVHKPAPPPAIPEETTMPKGTKTCTNCKESKGATAFTKGETECRLCQKAGKVAPAREKSARVNGANRSIADIAAEHAGNGSRFAGTVEQLRAEAAKYAAAADALEALG